jgi:glycine C-acetyltransferase
LDEPWRIDQLNANTKQFIGGLKSAGFDTLLTETAIVPVLCGSDERAFALTREAQHRDVFVLPVVSPAVPDGLARLRATKTDRVFTATLDCGETDCALTADAFLTIQYRGPNMTVLARVPVQP